MCLIIVHYDGHRHVVIFGAASLDSLLEQGASVNLTNGTLGIVGNGKSVEIVIAKGCWVPKLSRSTVAYENIITWHDILFCLATGLQKSNNSSVTGE